MSKNLINIDLTLLQLKNLNRNKIVIAGISTNFKKHNYYPFFFFRKKIDSVLLYLLIMILILLNFLSCIFLINNINLVLNFNTNSEITPKFFFSKLQNDDLYLIRSVYSVLIIK